MPIDPNKPLLRLNVTQTFKLHHAPQRSVYDCLYLALAEAIDGVMITGDHKFYSSLTGGTYGRRVLWVEDLPQVT